MGLLQFVTFGVLEWVGGFPLTWSDIHETKRNPRELTALLFEFQGPLKICLLFSPLDLCLSYMSHPGFLAILSRRIRENKSTLPFWKQRSSAVLETLAYLNTCCIFMHTPRELSDLLKSLFSGLIAHSLYDLTTLVCCSHYRHSWTSTAFLPLLIASTDC